MKIQTDQISIFADYREVPSEVPEILKELGIDVKLKSLKMGDYIINNEIAIERKSKDDFIVSLIQGRLFSQCARLKKSNNHTLLLIEGNPYNTNHNIQRQAIKGALLSVSLSWQIPIIYSADKHDSAQMLIMSAHQLLKESNSFYRKGRYPKKFKNKAIYFLQGLPTVGAVLAKALIEKFGSAENVILADEAELREVEGLGHKKAKIIREFLNTSFNKT